MTRKMIASLQISLDGFAQGSDQGGEAWVDCWADALGITPDVDTFVQGAGMYPGYAAYWSAIAGNPKAPPPFQTRAPYEREIRYAEFAGKTPHYVVSKTLSGVAWPPTARIVRDIAEIAALKAQPGKNVYVVGGTKLVTALLNAGILDELRLIVNPLLLGGGQPLFGGVTERKPLRFVKAEPIDGGRVVLVYEV